MKELKYFLPKYAKFIFLSNSGGYTCVSNYIKHAVSSPSQSLQIVRAQGKAPRAQLHWREPGDHSYPVTQSLGEEK